MRHRVAARNAFHNTNIGVTADNFILQLPLSGRPSGRLGYDPTIPRSMKDVMTQTLFPRFASTIQTATRFDLTMPGSDHPFFLDAADARGRNVCMMYAPFDHINHSARIAIVGMTRVRTKPNRLCSPQRQRSFRANPKLKPQPSQRRMPASRASRCAPTLSG